MLGWLWNERAGQYQRDLSLKSENRVIESSGHRAIGSLSHLVIRSLKKMIGSRLFNGSMTR
jgi:hypothetical protein